MLVPQNWSIGPIWNIGTSLTHSYDVRHEKTDLKVFVVVIPKEGWARMAASILLLV